MSPPHGVGANIVVVGGTMIVGGWLVAAKLTLNDTDDPESSRMPRLAAFNTRAARFMRRVALAGIPVVIVGSIVWAASQR